MSECGGRLSRTTYIKLYASVFIGVGADRGSLQLFPSRTTYIKLYASVFIGVGADRGSLQLFPVGHLS